MSTGVINGYSSLTTTAEGFLFLTPFPRLETRGQLWSKNAYDRSSSRASFWSNDGAMSYSDFTIEQAIDQFELVASTVTFDIEPLASSPALDAALKRYLPLATSISTEKARNELIVTPILLEVRAHFQDRISYFSGRSLTVDPNLGLNGECDFILSADANQTVVQVPIVVIVEAKNADLTGGLGQCTAQMVGAARFNERRGLRHTIRGAVTTGTNWKLLMLEQQQLKISLEEYLVPPQLPSVLGFLAQPFQSLFASVIL